MRFLKTLVVATAALTPMAAALAHSESPAIESPAGQELIRKYLQSLPAEERVAESQKIQQKPEYAKAVIDRQRLAEAKSALSATGERLQKDVDGMVSHMEDLLGRTSE